MSRRILVISCWLGVASTRAQSSTPSMAAASRSAVKPPAGRGSRNVMPQVWSTLEKDRG
jgi:hypothetical protein